MRRFERDIHDGPQQRLMRLQLDLARAERADDPEKVRALLGEIRTQASQTLDELRQTTRGIAPQVLTEHGLAAACDEIAGRSPLPMRVHIDMPRIAAPSSGSVLRHRRVGDERHQARRGQSIRVSGHVVGDSAVVTIVDDGRGGADTAKGSGLVGLEKRLQAVDGHLRVDSPAGGPTTIEGNVPCASS